MSRWQHCGISYISGLMREFRQPDYNNRRIVQESCCSFLLFECVLIVLIVYLTNRNRTSPNWLAPQVRVVGASIYLIPPVREITAMNTRNRNSITYNNTRNSGRYNVPGQFVSAGELAPAAAPAPAPASRSSGDNATSSAQHFDYYQQPDPQPNVNFPMKPKKEPTTPNINSNLQQVPLQNSDVEMKESSGEAGQERPKWMKSKLQGVKKISTKERRRRQNQTLRRLLTPKNALMVLNEMVPHEQVANQFKVEPSPAPHHHHYYGSKAPHTFAAELTLHGANYKGYGENKLSARNACAELAIRDIIIKKMNKVMAADGSSTGGGGEAGAEGEGGDEDSLPMLQLASFALHKLFTEWEYNGHKVPQLKPHTNSVSEATPSETGSTAGGGAKGAKGGAKKPRAIPSNAAAMHPCMLLTYLRPSLEYREVEARGDRPQNMTYTVAVTVDGNVYTGQAASKKEARKEAARAACHDLFNVVFDPQVTANAPLHN